MKSRRLFSRDVFVAPVAGESGSAIVIVLLIMALLSIIAFSVNRTSMTESWIIRNVLEGQRDFYFTESAIYPMAQRINKGTLFPVTFIDRKTIFTDVTCDGAAVAGPLYEDEHDADDWSDTLADFTDSVWPTANTGLDTEYAFRVYFKGRGDNPKGYSDAKFSTYLYDIAVRKQLTEGGAIEDSSVIINKGHRKVGPKIT